VSTAGALLVLLAAGVLVALVLIVALSFAERS
jgi:hypothetical protein